MCVWIFEMAVNAEKFEIVGNIRESNGTKQTRNPKEKSSSWMWEREWDASDAAADVPAFTYTIGA